MEQQNNRQIEAALQAPFPATDIEWRAQRVGIANGKPWAYVLAYVTNRAIQTRLDEVFGADGWQNLIREWRDKSTVCGISVRFGDEWITKWDGADETDIEATKGGISDAMKRAAVHWGIGRYLYKLEANFAECSMERQRGPEWHQAAVDKKAGQYIYWKTPSLPDWALPKPDAATPPRQPAPPPQPPKPAAPQKPVDKISALLTYMAAFKTTREDLEKAIGYKVEEFKDVDFDSVRETVKLMKVNPQWTFADAWAELRQGA